MQEKHFQPIGDVLSDLMKRLVENDPALTEEEIDDAVFSKQVSRREQIIAEVRGKGTGCWDAYDQGRLAFHDGMAFADNPHRIHQKSVGYHVNMGEWDRGWSHEAENV